MKKLTFLTLMAMAWQFALAQRPADVTYAQLNDPEFCVNIPLGFDVDSYQAQDGTVFKVGSKLIIGRPSTNSDEYTYIVQGYALTALPLKIINQIENVVIDKIMVQPQSGKLSKKFPRLIWFKVKSTDTDLVRTRTILDYEKALILGEVINPSAPMSRDEAIRKLKESKDLLDLGMITQVKYDSIKGALSPIIMKQ